MNTEQIKTAEEIATIIWASKHCGSSHVQLIENFASQESKRAVDEFKEKLKTVLVRYWHKKTGDEIYDLIDSELQAMFDKL